jgi:tol-pal system protein YbgF
VAPSVRTLGVLIAAVAIFSGVGCVSSTQGKQMQRDVLALQAQFDELRADKDLVKQTLERAKKEIASLEKSNKAATELLRRLGAQSGVQIDSLRVEVSKLRGLQEEAKHEIERLKKSFDELKTLASAPKGPAPLPQESGALYQFGVDAYQKGDLRDAVRAFRGFVTKFPDDPYADNAQYLLGDCMFLRGDFVEAVAELQVILTTYPSGEKADDAYFRIGEAFDAMGKCAEARVFYKEVQNKFPKSRRVAEVKTKLKAKCKT